MSHALFDAIKKEKGIQTDVELSAALGLNANQVNRYRNGRDPITASLILKIYDASGFSIERIRELAADTATPKVRAARMVKLEPRPWHAVQSSIAAANAPKWVSRVHRVR